MTLEEARKALHEARAAWAAEPGDPARWEQVKEAHAQLARALQAERERRVALDEEPAPEDE